MEAVPEVFGLTTGSGTVEEADEADEPPPAILRGLLTLTLSRPSRIRDITIKLRGMARTEWPEGIGPRRLDVMEETVLIAETFTFFSASNLSNERRAASMGPGAQPDQVDDNDSRGRTGRRAASMMPTRESSVGLAYPSRDSAIHEDELAEVAPRGRRSAVPLSRIASSASLETMGDEAPPVLPWEPSPAYEAVPSLPNSPVTRPVVMQAIGSEDSRRGRSPSRPGQGGRFDLSPSPSPLGPSRASSFADSIPAPLPLSRQLTSVSRLSQEDSTTPPASPTATVHRPPLHTAPSNDGITSASSTATSFVDTSDPDTPAGWNSAPVPGSTRSSFERGRPPARVTNGMSNLSLESGRSPSPPRTEVQNGPTYQSFGSQRGVAGEAPAVRRAGSTHSTSSVPTPSTAPSTRTARAVSVNPPPASSVRAGSAKPSGRFSLAGLTDALRGKSMSRQRDVSIGPEETSRRRAESPDTRSGSARGESRGRKTALKVLRSALTSDPDALGDNDDSDDDGFDDADDGKGKGLSKGWKEFRAGTYTYPISIPIAASLPPSVQSEFGSVSYALKATIHRAGALTPNLTAVADVILVSTPGQDDTEENESIVVERFWETQMKYHIALSGKSFPIGGTIPVSIRLNPMAKIKLYRVAAVLEQKTTYFASGRKLTRHETPKKYPLMRIENKDPKEALLPIFTDDPDVIKNHPLAEFFVNPTSADDTTPACFDPIGPWHLESTIKLPDCSTRLNFSTIHDKANINISHILKIMLRVERGDDDFLDSKGKRKLWDVIIETPIHILSCRCTQNTLPAYSSVTSNGVIGSPSMGTSSFSTFGAAPGCGFNHSAPSGAVPAARGTPSSMSNIGRSSSANAQPAIATIEQNLLFARLVAGEETPAGEVPPSYNAVITHDPSAVEALRAHLAILKSHHGVTTTTAAPLTAAARPAPLHALTTALLPDSSSTSPRFRLDEPIEKAVSRARERTRAFRITGRSCFEVELEVGKRARREMEEKLEQGKGKEKGKEGDEIGPRWVRKGVAVRLETFYQGRFFEPHYVVFGPPERPGDENEGATPLEIIHHTLPPWIPLRQLSNQYLGIKTRGDERLGEEGDGTDEGVPAELAPDLDVS
ncbi:hypothetical protein RQP46_000716 [Phenoliferia psychrophenolica]